MDGLRFACDAMLGGLARWLRGAGYDATFDPGIDDGVLVRHAAAEGRVLLSSDGGIFERNAVKRGEVASLFVPRATPPVEQLKVVLDAFGLSPRDSRCMACGGALAGIEKDTVVDEVPARAFAANDEFWRCEGCAKVFWRGTHWARIARVLAEHGAASLTRERDRGSH